MKEKKEITEQDLEILQKHINKTKLRIIDMNNQFNKAIKRTTWIEIESISSM